MKVEMFVITDRREKPKSYLDVNGMWNELSDKTRFFSKPSRAYEAIQYITATTKTIDVESVTITVE